jgi:hypothetical protein
MGSKLEDRSSIHSTYPFSRLFDIESCLSVRSGFAVNILIVHGA